MIHTMSFASDKSINFSVPPFSPFNGFDKQPECKGVGVLAIEKVIINLEEDFTLALLPYARILNSLKTGQLDLAILFKNNTVAENIEYIGPLSMAKVLVITQSGTTVKHYKDLYQLDSIGVIRSAQFNNRFDQDELLKKVNVNSYSQAVKLLKLKRINAVIGSKIGLEYALYHENMSNELIADAFYLGDKELGLHLSKKSALISNLPLIKNAVKSAYQANLTEQLYRQQMNECYSKIY